LYFKAGGEGEMERRREYICCENVREFASEK